jgi:hypothetical protein
MEEIPRNGSSTEKQRQSSQDLQLHILSKFNHLEMERTCTLLALAQDGGNSSNTTEDSLETCMMTRSSMFWMVRMKKDNKLSFLAPSPIPLVKDGESFTLLISLLIELRELTRDSDTRLVNHSSSNLDSQ